MAEITREDLERRVKRRENLKDMDLSGLNLDDLAMEGAIFRKCKLTGTTFNHARMAFARFENCLMNDCETVSYTHLRAHETSG